MKNSDQQPVTQHKRFSRLWRDHPNPDRSGLLLCWNRYLQFENLPLLAQKETVNYDDVVAFV